MFSRDMAHFRIITALFAGVQIFLIFTVNSTSGPIDIAKWIGVAVGAVLGLVLVVLLLKVVIGKLWGPQIEWYFRSRVSFVGPKPAEGKFFFSCYNSYVNIASVWNFPIGSLVNIDQSLPSH